MSADELAPYLSSLRLDGPEEPFRVLADWLQSRGEAWGKLIALQLGGKSDEALEAEVLDRRPFTATWVRGFARAAVVTVPSAAGRKLAEERRALVRRGLGNPVFSLLERLDVAGFSDAHVVEAILDQPLPKSLKELSLGGVNADLRWLTKLANWPVLSQLRRLALPGARLDEGGRDVLLARTAAFAHLERLELGTCYSRADIEAVVRVLPRAQLGFYDPQAAFDAFRESGPEHRAFIRAQGGPRSIEDIDD